MSDDAEVIIAIDPGRAKCGVAIVASDGVACHRSIVATADLAALLPPLVTGREVRAIVLGNGTGSAAVQTVLTRLFAGVPLVCVDERHTSELARGRYLADHPARGLRRLIPRPLRVPDAPYDDYAAAILGERWCRENASASGAVRPRGVPPG